MRLSAGVWHAVACLGLILLVGCGDGALTVGEGVLLRTELPGDRAAMTVKAGSMSSNLRFLLYNAGASPVTIYEARLVGAAPGVFRLASKLSFPLVLAPGQAHGVSVELVYAPPKGIAHTGQLGFSLEPSGAADGRSFVVGLNGLVEMGSLHTACRDGLDFGEVRIGKKKTLACEIENRGDVAVTITALVYQPEMGGQREFLLREPSLPLRIEPGVSTTLLLSYAPRYDGYPRDRGRLVIESDMLRQEGQEKPSIVVRGSTWQDPNARPCLVAEPSGLDFGAVAAVCGRAEKQLVLRNQGGPGCDVARVTGLSRKGAHEAFSILLGPSGEQLLRPGDSAKLTLRFAPQAVGRVQEMLQIETSQGKAGGLLVPLSGVADMRRRRVTETFRQLPQRAKDILFVIHNAPSMKARRESLMKNLRQLIEERVRWSTDYHIMVITTDVSGASHPPGCAVGEVKVITSDTPDPFGTFMNNVDLGFNGSSHGQGLEAMRLALSPKMLDDPTCNKGFLHDLDGYRTLSHWYSMEVIVVSDADDQSPAPVSWYANQLRYRRKGLTSDWVRFSVVGLPNPNGFCRYPDDNREPFVSRYWEMSQLLRGFQAPICSESWASTLYPLHFDAFGYRTAFYLSQRPEAASLSVAVNGKPVTRLEKGRYGDSENWTYRSENRSIHFTKQSIPPPGARIEVTYLPACGPWLCADWYPFEFIPVPFAVPKNAQGWTHGASFMASP